LEDKQRDDVEAAAVKAVRPSENVRAQMLTLRGLGAAGIGLMAVAPPVIAAFLMPATAGHGTHEQLGMPACGWAIWFGKPCMTCGMTTAFAHAVRMEWWKAFQAQPMGLMLAIGCGVVFWTGVYSATTGASALRAMLNAAARPRAMWWMGALTAGAWAYKWVTWGA
jgi:Protein of unknown function (DUF2752)